MWGADEEFRLLYGCLLPSSFMKGFMFTGWTFEESQDGTFHGSDLLYNVVGLLFWTFLSFSPKLLFKYSRVTCLTLFSWMPVEFLLFLWLFGCLQLATIPFFSSLRLDSLEIELVVVGFAKEYFLRYLLVRKHSKVSGTYCCQFIVGSETPES